MKQIKQAELSDQYMKSLVIEAHRILFEIAGSPGMNIEHMRARVFSAIDLLKEFKDTIEDNKVSLKIEAKYW